MDQMSKPIIPKQHLLESLSIIIPSYNGVQVIGQCLGILQSIAPKAEVIVVDGGSTDGSQELVKTQFPHVQLLEVPNFGWAHATNRGFEMARGRFLMTLNSDVFLTLDALEAMITRLNQNPKIGGIQPYLLNGDGSRQLVFGIFYPPHWTKMQKPVNAPVLSGACIMTRRDVLEHVGGFDENFFFYNEEFDWCWRARKLGYKMELRQERVIHLEGASTPKHSHFQLEAQRGALYLITKHFHPWIAEAFRFGLQGLSWLMQDFDPRKNYRDAWRKIEGISRERQYLATPFQLSGRGEVHFSESRRMRPPLMAKDSRLSKTSVKDTSPMAGN
jgi:N-acetylglucosaminyl-diphospho-decaprenol L-rhamnosyltransferase